MNWVENNVRENNRTTDEIFTKLYRASKFFSRVTLLYPVDRKSNFIRKNFSRNCTCFLIHIKYKLCTCSLLIWHNITYRLISWSVNQQDGCEKKLREYWHVFFTVLLGWVNMNSEVPLTAIHSQVVIFLPIFQERLRWSVLPLCTRQTVCSCKLIKMKSVAEEATKLSFHIRYKIYECLKILTYPLPGDRSVI